LYNNRFENDGTLIEKHILCKNELVTIMIHFSLVRGFHMRIIFESVDDQKYLNVFINSCVLFGARNILRIIFPCLANVKQEQLNAREPKIATKVFINNIEIC